MKEKIKKIVTEITLEKAIKLSILLVILLVGFAVFYHYVIFLPKKEEARLEQQRQEQLAKEFKEREEQEKEQQEKEEAKQALEACIANAETGYHNEWKEECKARGKLTSRCISLLDMTFEEYAEQNNIPDDAIERITARLDFYNEQDECSCSLPLSIADRVNETLQKNKDYCLKRYPIK